MNGEASKAAGLVANIQKLADSRKNLRTFVVFMGGPELKDPLQKLAAEKKVTIPLTFLPGGPRSGDVAGYNINPKTKNTILLWRGQRVRTTLTNIDEKNFSELEKAVDELVK